MTTVLDPADAFDLNFVRDARISPDGSTVVYAVSSTIRGASADSSVLWTLDLQSGDRRALTDAQGVATAPRWSPDGNAIAYVESSDTPSLMVVPAAGGEPRRLTPEGQVVVGAPTWAPDGRRIAVAAGTPLQPDTTVLRVTSRVFRAEGFGLVDAMSLGICVADVSGEHTGMLLEGTSAFQCSEPRWSPRGDRILFVAQFDVTTSLVAFPKLRTVDVTSGEVHDVLGDWGGAEVAEWLPGGERIAFIGAPAGSRVMTNMGLWIVGDDGVPERRLPDGPWHVGSRAYQDLPLWDLILAGGLVVESARHACVTVQTGGAAVIWKVALTGPEEHTEIAGGERTCIVVDSHPDTGRLFVATDLFHPTELYLAGDRERRLTHLNDEILASWPDMRAEHLRISAPDALEFDGWFFTRSDAHGPQPTVLHIHGGPFTTVGHVFRFDFHLLASRGIGVTFSNFRGSTGYGQEFMDAIGNDWGAAGFPDHMATIDAAIDRGLADRDRLGVWGASHGGLATSWIVGHTSRFAAAIAEASVTDYVLAYYTCDIPDAWAVQHGGRPDQVGDLMRARSPLTYAANCTTPILMLHCEGDLRCPLNQAEAFHRAVLDAGGTSEIAAIHGGSHIGDAMGPPAVRLAQDEALLDWFTRYLTAPG
ncbi:dipeptidyl-peptidase 5 [Amycolatopsis jiangsuensis]|uniref:Dipeptidyl aminopeptidase/acylaminoacyl peptidase n=1 Tax=Amycolatopsis jiangsuensis TaxID=1181879 RepID=A0A840ISV6_9PSEU|nr:S9 family peptidase [Amycolatopsis jiangsuensis]MBB4684619.1 dipeptidyl aminopeptidase/acylaminoacyl peptidase [Amycolatopsis jiangsuensis]